MRVYFKPSLAPDISADAVQEKGSRFAAGLKMLPSAFVFFMVMGLIILGIATPTEAAATGVLGALMLAAFYGRLSAKLVTEAVFTAATVGSLLLVIMCSAVMFSQLLTVTGAAREMGQAVVSLSLSPALMLFLMMAVPFILFMFLDQVALMLVLVPIYQPIIRIYGFDDIWFWTLFLIVATVGGLTPPFGYVLFALKSAAPDVPLQIDLSCILALRVDHRCRDGSVCLISWPDHFSAESDQLALREICRLRGRGPNEYRERVYAPLPSQPASSRRQRYSSNSKNSSRKWSMSSAGARIALRHHQPEGIDPYRSWLPGWTA